MAYTRKTYDEWQLWINYGQGFEEVTASDTYSGITSLSKDYAENEPQYQRRIKCKRIPIAKSIV